jgi:hypothetical protein
MLREELNEQASRDRTETDSHGDEGDVPQVPENVGPYDPLDFVDEYETTGRRGNSKMVQALLQPHHRNTILNLASRVAEDNITTSHAELRLFCENLLLLQSTFGGNRERDDEVVDMLVRVLKDARAVPNMT